jgi:hypothetical protein
VQLAKHLHHFALIKYDNLMIHAEFSMEDRYVFTTNRLLRELNMLALRYDVRVEIINIEYENKFAIPTFILMTERHMNNVSFRRDLELFFDKCHIEFTAAFIKSYF